jgi:zinc protease
VDSAESLSEILPEEVMEFRARYYVPNNAVLAIVGNIQPARAKELVSRYFDSIPPGNAVPTPPLPHFEQKREVVRTLRESLVPYPGFHVGYRFYPLQTGDAYSLRILEYLLLRGRTSRLYTRIMKKDLTAQTLNGSLEDRHGVLALRIFATNNNDVMAQRCLKAVLSEIDKLKVNLASEEEVDKAKNLFKMDYLRRLSTRLDRALYLADAAFNEIPISSLSGELDKYMRVNPQTLNSLMSRFFVPQNRVILNLGTR